MSEGFEGYNFNIVRARGSPTEATLQSGHRVEKQEYVYFRNTEGQWMTVKCADYHGAHFLYLDPMYNEDPKQVDPNKEITGRGHWFAMCTCGSPAVIVGPEEAGYEDSDAPANLLVCYIYHLTLRTGGHGYHQGSDPRPWH